MSLRIHILGPSGAGTSTLASNLSKQLGLLHLDTDNYFWKKTRIPFTEKNPIGTRLEKIRTDISNRPDWVLSGSICNWGEPLIEHFTHVVFLWIPWDIRKERLLKRELEMHGSEALKPGGCMHRVNSEFMDWASKYDSAGLEQRSRLTHEEWMKNLPSHIPLIRIEQNLSPSTITKIVIEKIAL